MGVLPNLFLRPIEPSVERMLNHFHQGAATRIQADSASPRRPSGPEPSALSHQP